MMNGKGGPGVRWEQSHKNSGSSTQAVALDVTPSPWHTWNCLFPGDMAWVHCLIIQEQTCFMGMTAYVPW